MTGILQYILGLLYPPTESCNIVTDCENAIAQLAIVELALQPGGGEGKHAAERKLGRRCYSRLGMSTLAITSWRQKIPAFIQAHFSFLCDHCVEKNGDACGRLQKLLLLFENEKNIYLEHDTTKKNINVFVTYKMVNRTAIELPYLCRET